MSNLEISEQTKRVTILTFSDKLDAFYAPKARQEINTLWDKGTRHFAINLADVSFMDSAGIAVLVNLLKRVRQENGTIKLVQPTNPSALRMLRLTKFDKIFDMFDTIEEAIASF